LSSIRGRQVQAASYSEVYRVPFGDTDAAGVVFYPNYYRWFDRMTHALFRSVGQPLGPFMDAGEGPFLVETNCRFLLPVGYDDEIRLESRVREIRTSAFEVEHTVKREGKVAATGREIRVWSSLHERRSVPLPAALKAALLSGHSVESA